MRKLKILIADDHAILRSGLSMMLKFQEDIEVVGEASNGAEALTGVETLAPDIILLDLSMPGIGGLEIIPQLHKSSPETRILVLTMHEEEAYLRQALQSGASGYVLKKAVDSELLNAIRAVARGEIYIHSALNHKLLDNIMPTDLHDETSATPWQQLSEREFDVLRLVALGYTSPEVADELSLSTKTIETYRARGMDKLGFRTRAQLVRSALTYHIIE